MMNMRSFSGLGVLLLFCFGCSMLAPAGRSQQVSGQSVNASVSGRGTSSSVGGGASVSAGVHAEEQDGLGGSMNSGGSTGTAGSASSLSSFSTGSAFAGGGAGFSVPLNAASMGKTSGMASQYESGGMQAGSVAAASDSVKYAVMGQFPDSTKGTGWPTPPLNNDRYSLAFQTSELLWDPNYDSLHHLNPNYLVSIQGTNHGTNARGKLHKLRSAEEFLRRFSDVLENENTALQTNLLRTSLKSKAGSLSGSNQLK